MEYIALLSGFVLIVIGLLGILTRKNIFKIVIGFSVFNTGFHFVILSIGYIKGKTAPIIDGVLSAAAAGNGVVDPIPQALTLTAIVIGLGITALMLAYAIKIYEKKRTLEIDKIEDLKW